MTRTKRTKSGSSLIGSKLVGSKLAGSKLVGSKLVGSRLAVVLVCGLLSSAAGKKPEPYAVVAGTVFREDGFSLPGASVTLLPKDAPKGKKLEAVSDVRGEFAFRVPAGAAAYVVKAARKGFQPAEKEASLSGEGRVDVTLTLSAESK